MSKGQVNNEPALQVMMLNAKLVPACLLLGAHATNLNLFDHCRFGTGCATNGGFELAARVGVLS